MEPSGRRAGLPSMSVDSVLSHSFGVSKYNYSSYLANKPEDPAILVAFTRMKGNLQKAGGGHSLTYEK